MGPVVIATVVTNMEFVGGAGLRSVAGNNIRDLCSFILVNYPQLKYRVSKVAPSVVIDVYELDDDQCNELLLKIKALKYVEGAEKVNTDA